jgi:hypothetical protein
MTPHTLTHMHELPLRQHMMPHTFTRMHDIASVCRRRNDSIGSLVRGSTVPFRSIAHSITHLIVQQLLLLLLLLLQTVTELLLLLLLPVLEVLVVLATMSAIVANVVGAATLSVPVVLLCSTQH